MKQNNESYTKLINEKLNKQYALESQISRKDTGGEATGRQNQTQGITVESPVKGGDESLLSSVRPEEDSRHPDPQSQMRTLKQMIKKLYLKVKGSNANDDPEEHTNIIHQLGVIQKSVQLMDETRDYIINKYHFYKGHDDINEEDAAEVFKKLQEAEKAVDKNRKAIRLERKNQMEVQQELQARLKLQKRQERSSKDVKSDNPQRPMVMRSKKPDMKAKDEKSERLMTQEELDYKRYVASIGDNNGS